MAQVDECGVCHTKSIITTMRTTMGYGLEVLQLELAWFISPIGSMENGIRPNEGSFGP